MSEFSTGEYAEVILKVLEFLKEYKVSQNQISDRINYYSLSKVKNYEKYPQKVIEGKNRAEVFNSILKEYNLNYDFSNDSFHSLHGDFNIEIPEIEQLYYVLYYYSYAKQIVGKGLVSIKEKKWATIDFNDPNHTPSLWKGTFDVVESYTFLSLEKRGDTAPVKAFYSFFSGTIKHGRPILIGTYSTIKRDGSPTAGNIVMEKTESKELGLTKINGNTNPKITAFLLNKNFTLETITPPTIEDLPKLLLSNVFVGEYVFYWPYKQGVILEGSIKIKETAEVEAVFENKIFKGSASLTGNNSMHLELRNNNLNHNNVHAYLSVNNYSNKRYMIAGVMVAPSLLATPSSFPILLIKKGKTLSTKMIQKYFDLFRSPMINTIEPIELESLLK